MISGIALKKNKDFVTFSSSGINVIALGQISNRNLVSLDGSQIKIHSLESLNFLKVDPLNMVMF